MDSMISKNPEISSGALVGPLENSHSAQDDGADREDA